MMLAGKRNYRPPADGRLLSKKKTKIRGRDEISAGVGHHAVIHAAAITKNAGDALDGRVVGVRDAIGIKTP
jgi:hypothetical protein